MPADLFNDIRTEAVAAAARSQSDQWILERIGWRLKNELDKQSRRKDTLGAERELFGSLFQGNYSMRQAKGMTEQAVLLNELLSLLEDSDQLILLRYIHDLPLTALERKQKERIIDDLLERLGR